MQAPSFYSVPILSFSGNALLTSLTTSRHAPVSQLCFVFSLSTIPRDLFSSSLLFIFFPPVSPSSPPPIKFDELCLYIIFSRSGYRFFLRCAGFIVESHRIIYSDESILSSSQLPLILSYAVIFLPGSLFIPCTKFRRRAIEKRT